MTVAVWWYWQSVTELCLVTFPHCLLSMCCLSTGIQYVQYVALFTRTNRLWSPTHRADRSNIFYAHKSNKRSPTHTECQKTKSKSYQLREREKEKEKAKAPFFYKWNAGEKNTKYGDARSVQPLKVPHSQRSVPFAVCSVTSAAAASSPPPPLAWDEWSQPSP